MKSHPVDTGWMTRGQLTLAILMMSTLYCVGFIGTAVEIKDLAFYSMLIVGFIIHHSRIASALAESEQVRAQLTQAQAQLAQASTHLESEVTARTAEIRASYDEAQAVIQARSATVLELAHDLRNYTQTLSAQATFLEWSYADLQAGVAPTLGEDIPSILNTLHRSIDRVTDFARALHDTALLEHNQFSMQIALCGLSDLIRGVTTPLTALFAQQQIALIVCPPPQNLVVHADPDYLRRILENVLGNALKFTASQTTHGRRSEGQVIVAWERQADSAQAQITITDNGIGVAPADLALMGKRFARAHQRQIAGSGVGLHFAMRVIESMGGKVTISSAGQGCGTTVAIMLPLGEAYSAAPESPLLQTYCALAY